MAASTIRHTKVTGSSGGTTGKMKKDGYAAGKVPDVVVGGKPGKVKGQGYSGPNVTRGGFEK